MHLTPSQAKPAALLQKSGRIAKTEQFTRSDTFFQSKPQAPPDVRDVVDDLEDFEDETGVVLPDGPYETVAGFLVAALTRLPVVGDTVVEGDNEFRVVELDGRRISRVSVTSVQPATPVAESAPDLED